MRPITLALALLTLAFVPALVGTALPARGQDRPTVIERVLTETERALLEEYLHRRAEERPTQGEKPRRIRDGSDLHLPPGLRNRDGLPPGLQNRDGLPPGLARQVERNGTLPPGLDARPLPDDLERRLPRREHSRRMIVGNDVVLIEEGTGRILDILRGAADVERGGTR